MEIEEVLKKFPHLSAAAKEKAQKIAGEIQDICFAMPFAAESEDKAEVESILPLILLLIHCDDNCPSTLQWATLQKLVKNDIPNI